MNKHPFTPAQTFKTTASMSGLKPKTLVVTVVFALTSLVGATSPVGAALSPTENDTSSEETTTTSLPDGAEMPEKPVVTELNSAEVAKKQAEIEENLKKAGGDIEAARLMLADLETKLEETNLKLSDRRLELVAGEKAQEQAEKELDEARKELEEARKELEIRHDKLRESVVDLYINPPAVDEMRLALTGSINEAQTTKGLLVGRADHMETVWAEQKEAKNAKVKADREAQKKVKASQQAVADTKKALQELEDEQEQREGLLQETELNLEVFEAQALKLEGEQDVLELVVKTQKLAESGKVTVTVAADGTWVAEATNLPGRQDMVLLPGTTILIHKLISENAQAMLEAAAADGVILNGWGWRDTAKQIQLRQEHCGTSMQAVFAAPSSSCSPPTARPGRSMHERGLAIDIANCSSRSLACYQWLSAHASEYGFFNLPSEPWHWSTTGN